MNVELPETLVIIESIVYKSNGFAIINQEEVLSHYLTLRKKPKLKSGLNKNQGN